MEGVSGGSYKGVRGYWKRRGYQRLNGSGRRRRNRVELATLGSTRRRQFWRIRITPKLGFFRWGSPKKFFARLRDAYVKMMLGIANSRVFISGYGGGAIGDGGFGMGRRKEYDEKMIVEIYKSLMIAQGQLVPRDAATIGNR